MMLLLSSFLRLYGVNSRTGDNITPSDIKQHEMRRPASSFPVMFDRYFTSSDKTYFDSSCVRNVRIRIASHSMRCDDLYDV